MSNSIAGDGPPARRIARVAEGKGRATARRQRAASAAPPLAAGRRLYEVKLSRWLYDSDDASEKPEPVEIQLDAAKQLSMEAFQTALTKMINLVIDGAPGTLHSVRSLRNLKLRKRRGDQKLALEKVMDKLGGTFGDDMKQMALALTGCGLPLALAMPMWLRLRRTALLCELCGHDARARIGDVATCAFGVAAAGAGLETATQLVWKMWAGPVAGLLPVGAVVRAVSDSDAKAAEEVRKAFAADQRPIPPTSGTAQARSTTSVSRRRRAPRWRSACSSASSASAAQKLAGKACDAATTSVGNTTAAVVVSAADGVRRGSASSARCSAASDLRAYRGSIIIASTGRGS